MTPLFSGKILKKIIIQYYQCPVCEYLCTEEPYWLEEAYKRPINVTDTGILSRNIYLSKITSSIIFLLFSKNIQCLDYGGGYGIFTRLMRDIGYDFYWYDPYSANLFAQGFEYSKKDNKVDFITSFENYEHFVYPMADIGKIYKLSHKILFSTQLLPNPIPKPEEWWYYGLEHGQHVSFYSKKTLKYIADKFSLQYYPINNGLHFFSDKRMSPILWFLITKFYPIIFPFIIMKKSSKTFQDMIYIKKKMEIE